MLRSIVHAGVDYVQAVVSGMWAIRGDIAPDTLISLMSQPEPTVEAGRDEHGRWMAAKPSIKGNVPGKKIAVIPIEGVLTKDGPSWWGSNYNTIAKAVADAEANTEVSHIVLAVDSPGGEVPGTLETGAVIAKAAKTKPVTAMVDGQAASAAYWLASQASQIVLTPSGSVGSVGVRTMHMDLSKYLENEGVAITELSAGEHKTEWSRYKPLGDGAKADMQAKLDEVHQQFISAVAQGRGSKASKDIQDRRFGEGRMFQASDAVRHGLVDSVQSSRDFYASIMPQPEAPTAGQAGGNFPFRLEVDSARAEAGF